MLEKETIIMDLNNDLTNLDPEIVRTKGIMIAQLYRDREPIIEACQVVQISTKVKAEGGGYKLETEIIKRPCERIDGDHCSACAFPDKKWRSGICNVSTHLTIENKTGQPQKFITPIMIVVKDIEANKKFVNPLKLSKRRNR